MSLREEDSDRIVTELDGSAGGGGPTRRKFLLTSGTATGLLLAGCTGSGDLTVEGLEITQAIQHYDNPNGESDNSLTLVRGKRVFVRAYVDGDSSADVDGQLRVDVEGTELSTSPIISENGPISPPSSLDREVTDHTLNFQLLVPEQGYGSGAVDVDFSLEVDNGEDPETDAYEEASFEETGVTFECNRSPSIAYVPIDYTFDGEDDPDNTGLPDSSMIQPGFGDDFMWHSFPIPEPPNYYEASRDPLEWDEEITRWSATDVINELETIRTMLSPQPDFVYGWLPGNPIGFNGAALGNAAFGNTEDIRYQRTFAHEIGHLLGLDHPSRTLDPEVGFYSSYPVHNIRTDDCDTSGTERTKCGQLDDVMVPGNLTDEAWVTPETYEHLANQGEIADHDECPGLVFPKLPRREYLFVTGTIPRDEEVGEFSLNPVYRLEGETKLTEEDQEGSRRIELRNESGEVVLARNFEVSFHGTDSEEPLDGAHFALTLPAENAEAVESVVLLSREEEVDRIKRPPAPTEIDVKTPEPDDTLRGEEVPIRWEASGEGELQFSVQYSPDQGETFVPVKVNTTETGFDLDTTRLPGSYEGAGMLRVIATDGLNTTVREVDGLTVGERKPPEVRITEPHVHEGSEEPFELGRGPVVLSGHAYDPEDGFLVPGSRSGNGDVEPMRWLLDGERGLGAGRTIQADLPEGEHEITLVAEDSDGNVGKDSVTVFVGK